MAVSIFSRYHGLTPIEVEGEAVLPARPLPDVGPLPDAIVHVMVAGESLDLLAKRYYGEERLWWRIADANPARPPYAFRPGDALVIPPLRIATRTQGR